GTAASAAASPVVSFLFFGGLLALFVRAVRRARVDRRWPFVHLEPEEERRALLFLWVASLWTFFLAARLEGVFPHYFIIAYPVPFAIAALALDDLRRLAARRFPRASAGVAAGLAAVLAGAFLLFDVQFY